MLLYLKLGMMNLIKSLLVGQLRKSNLMTAQIKEWILNIFELSKMPTKAYLKAFGQCTGKMVTPVTN